MSTETTTQIIICEWCGKMFNRAYSSGPAPKYCTKAHREAAYRSRLMERAETTLPADTELRIAQLIEDRYGMGRTWARAMARDIMKVVRGE